MVVDGARWPFPASQEVSRDPIMRQVTGYVVTHRKRLWLLIDIDRRDLRDFEARVVGFDGRPAAARRRLPPASIWRVGVASL